MALEITAFVSFRSRSNDTLAPALLSEGINETRRPLGKGVGEKTSLYPTDSDLLLSALEPFRGWPNVRMKVYDLSTTYGRFQGLLNDVFEAPAVIVCGERFLGSEASQLALSRLQEEVI